jgi:hypothetical protein
MSGMLVNLIVQIAAGAIGGNVAGALKDLSWVRLAIPSLAQSAAGSEGNFFLHSFRCSPMPEPASTLAHWSVKRLAAASPVQFLRRLLESSKTGQPNLLSLGIAVGKKTLVLLSCGLGGCTIPSSLNPFSSEGAQAERPSSYSLAWARNDGQLISGSPELTARARADIAECGAATPPVRTNSGVVGEGCMKARGYHVREIP